MGTRIPKLFRTDSVDVFWVDLRMPLLLWVSLGYPATMDHTLTVTPRGNSGEMMILLFSKETTTKGEGGGKHTYML